MWNPEPNCTCRGTPDARCAGEKICSVGVPSVREMESVDIEIESGAYVSCLPANIGADGYPRSQPVWLGDRHPS